MGVDRYEDRCLRSTITLVRSRYAPYLISLLIFADYRCRPHHASSKDITGLERSCKAPFGFLASGASSMFGAVLPYGQGAKSRLRLKPGGWCGKGGAGVGALHVKTSMYMRRTSAAPSLSLCTSPSDISLYEGPPSTISEFRRSNHAHAESRRCIYIWTSYQNTTGEAGHDLSVSL